MAMQYQGANGNPDQSNNGRKDEQKQNGDGFGMSFTWEGDAGFGVGGQPGVAHIAHRISVTIHTVLRGNMLRPRRPA